MNLRLVEIGQDGTVTLTAGSIGRAISPRDYTVQAVVLTLINQLNTNVDVPGWGGNMFGLGLKSHRKDEELRIDVADSIRQAQETLVGLNPGDPAYIVTALALKQVYKRDSTVFIKIKISYAGASSFVGELAVNRSS